VAGHLLNLRGEVCPLTFVHVRLWLEQAPIGASVAVEVDYEPATRSIERSLRILGQEFCGCETLPDGAWRLKLRKIVADPTEHSDGTKEREVDG
jgi:tRNA 2-thiouridine synthesizing protein A